MKAVLVKLCALTALPVILSCSVKEDRRGCPCVLTIDVSDCGKFTEVLSVEAWTEESRLFDDTFITGDYPDGYIRKVGRDGIWYTACAPLKDAVRDKFLINIREGMQSDYLFLYCKEVDSSEERAYDKVELHKNHMELGVLLHDRDFHDGAELELEVRAGYCGLDMMRMAPVGGMFRHRAKVKDGECRIRLPRQGDGPITMTLYRNGVQDIEIDAGKLLDGAGYSWNDSDLADVWFDLRDDSNDISVIIQGWAPGVSYPEVI